MYKVNISNKNIVPSTNCKFGLRVRTLEKFIESSFVRDRLPIILRFFPRDPLGFLGLLINFRESILSLSMSRLLISRRDPIREKKREEG